MMKAPVFKGVGKPLVIETVPDPSPAPDELIVKIGRCGICGSDLHSTLDSDWTLPEGSIFGHEFAGEVVEVGSAVNHYTVGERITALGVHTCGTCGFCLSGDPLWCGNRSHAEVGGAGQYAAVKAHASIRLPDELSLAEGALIEPLACALHAVKLAGQIVGARALVLGAGPLGLGVAFWARRLGAGRLAVSARSKRNENLAIALGGTHFLAADTLSRDLAMALGGPPDVIFECAGAPQLIVQAIELIRPRGTVIIAGACPVGDLIRPVPLLLKEVRVQGSFGFSLQEFQTVADVLASGANEPRRMITHTVSLAELPEAFEALRKPTVQCKVLIDPWA